jgi:hypothetical protein
MEMRSSSLPPLDHGAARQIWIGWGSGAVFVALAYFVGGSFWPFLLLAAGIVAVLRGHCPGWFSVDTEAQPIAGIPSRRYQSSRSWSAAVGIAVIFAFVASLAYKKLVPAKPDISDVVKNAIKDALARKMEAPIADHVMPAPGPDPPPPRFRTPISRPKSVARLDNQPAKIKLIFKDSPAFTPARKTSITREMDAFRSYLSDVGFDAPNELPPLDARPGGGIGFNLSNPGSIYDAQISIGEDILDDADKIRNVYAQWMFKYVVFRDAMLDMQGTYQLLVRNSADVFSCYYRGSLIGANVCPSPWLDALWEIRTKKGREFGDKLLLYTYRRWHWPPRSENPSFNELFSRMVSFGSYVLSSDVVSITPTPGGGASFAPVPGQGHDFVPSILRKYGLVK